MSVPMKLPLLEDPTIYMLGYETACLEIFKLNYLSYFVFHFVSCSCLGADPSRGSKILKWWFLNYNEG